MQGLASARLARDWPAVRFHPGDIDWWVVLDHGRVPGIGERVRLWFDSAAETELLGYSWFSLPGEVDFLVLPDDPAGLRSLIGSIIDWADERRTTLATMEPAPLTAWASADEPAVAVLTEYGLVADLGRGYVHFTGDLAIADAWGPPVVPAGVAIRSMSSPADIESRVACGRAAFTSSTMTVERYRMTAAARLYRPDLDVIAVEAPGRVVAFALGWLDPATGVVELEPVGVHPDWHRRGLGREICRAALRRARELGASRAVIGAERSNPAAMGLYAGLGLTIGTEINAFARPLRQVADAA